jgi:hypothetical protein
LLLAQAHATPRITDRPNPAKLAFYITK